MSRPTNKSHPLAGEQTRSSVLYRSRLRVRPGAKKLDLTQVTLCPKLSSPRANPNTATVVPLPRAASRYQEFKNAMCNERSLEE